MQAEMQTELQTQLQAGAQPVACSGAKAWGAVMLGVGAVLLLTVFTLALVTFSGLPGQLHAPSAATLEGLGRVLAVVAARTLLLFVMAFAASLLASKGLEFYHFSAVRPGR